MKRIIRIFAILALGAAFACTRESKENLAPYFQIDMDTYGAIGMEQYKMVRFIPVSTNIPETEWVIASSAPWCQASRSISSEKGVMIAVDSNTDKEELRQAQVTVKASGKTYKIIVSQFGYGPAILVNNVIVGPEGGQAYMDVMANIPVNESLIAKPSYNAEDGENWIRFVGIEENTKAFSTTRFIYDIATNELPDKREATVDVKAMNISDAAANTKCIITQNTIDVTNPAVFSDEKVSVLECVVNQDDPNYSGHATALVDGNYGTFYHSPAGADATKFPVVWNFTLNGKDRVDYINIMHRAGSTNGNYGRGQIGKFNVYARLAGENDYSFVQEFDFGGNGGYQTAWLTDPIENAESIRLELLAENADPNRGKPGDEYYDGQYICTAEVEFYNTNRSEVNDWINKLFTDLSCSELREGVTKKDIVKLNGISPYLASKVAIPLYNGTYEENEKDFRIHSYEPYSDNRVQKDLVMQFYSAMDNPTGIQVESGQDIIVCVDKVPEGQTVSLAVYGEESEYGPNYGGAGSNEGYNQNTLLKAGVNSVRINADGMAYIMNTVSLDNRADLSTFENVKVHILPGCGTVQGYFDPARHSDERYKEILSKYTYKYFMVKGARCLFLFHTNQVRSDFPQSIRGGIEAWDNLVAWEHELMGLDKVKWFNNHMMAVTSSNPDTYMNATNRRVQFGVKTISWICDAASLLEPGEGAGVCNIWGPAHEMGHCNQMAINWRSCTESSNNLFSNYACMKLAGDLYYKTRFSRGDKLEKLAKDFAAKRPWPLLGDGNYQNEDPGLHMRMNWQLWNYYHNCGFMPDFFPTLFNYFRDGHQLPNQDGPSYGRAEDAGLSQLEYYEACCIVSGQDLTEFFDVWGFFRTIDQTYEQYGTTNYKVTDDMINKAKARVRDMGLPKAAPIQYLEDRTEVNGDVHSQMGYWTQFREKKAITKTPSYEISGSNVTLTGCEEAVAVEVRQGSAATGELRYFSNMFKFTLPNGINLSNNTLWAVQADGTRVQVQKK